MTEIANFLITDVSITMADHGCLTFWFSVTGNGLGCNIGGYCIGKGYLGSDDFEGYAPGLECLMRIMDVVGVEKWEDLKGKYIRAEIGNIGCSVHKIGNIIKDKWFDIKEFFNNVPEKPQ